MKTCGTFVKVYKEKKLYCGRRKFFENKLVKIRCEVCKSYDKGWADGFTEKIKKTNICQIITCCKAASYVICDGEYLINVCRSHARGKDCRPVTKEDC